MSSGQHPSSMEAMLLPENIMFDILTRLPVKTIIYCKCVCRKWRELVSDTYFVRLHLSRSRHCLLISDYLSSRPLSLLWVEIEHEDGYFNTVKILDLKRYSIMSRLLQVSSVNGLICCYWAYDSICIFNPVFEEYMILPPVPLLKWLTLFFGFGVSSAGEYKVIRICCSINPSGIEVYDVQIEVYTIGTNQWRIVGQIPFQLNLTQEMTLGLIMKGPDRGEYLDSHVYWLIGGQIYNFDLIMETLELFPSPPAAASGGEFGRMLGVLKGSLSYISWCGLGLEVWVMKWGSWYKEIATQENVSVNLELRHWTPLGLTDSLKGGSILMVHNTRTRKLKAYCLDTNSIQHLVLQGSYSYSIMNYRPSFVKLYNFKSESSCLVQKVNSRPEE